MWTCLPTAHAGGQPGELGGIIWRDEKPAYHADRFEGIAAVVPFHPAKTTPGEVSKLRALVPIHTGTADRVVPVDEVRELEKVLRTQGTPVELFGYEGADHGLTAASEAMTPPWTRPVAIAGATRPGRRPTRRMRTTCSRSPSCSERPAPGSRTRSGPTRKVVWKPTP
jgi:acetyl esterase/lipase